MKSYRTESQDIRDHLVLRRSMEGIDKNQVRLDLMMQIGDIDMKIETALEEALHLEDVTSGEEEAKTPNLRLLDGMKQNN